MDGLKERLFFFFLQCAIAEVLHCSVAAATVNRIRHGLHKHLPWQQCTGARREAGRGAVKGKHHRWSAERQLTWVRDVFCHVFPLTAEENNPAH